MHLVQFDCQICCTPHTAGSLRHLCYWSLILCHSLWYYKRMFGLNGGGRYKGEGEEEGSSVVVHVSLKSCGSFSSVTPFLLLWKKAEQRTLRVMEALHHCWGSWAVDINHVKALSELAHSQWQEGGWAAGSLHPVFTFLLPSSQVYPSLFPGELPPLKGFNLWRHRCCRGLFVEEVAVDTDGREAAPEPETRANELRAAACRYWEYVAEPCWAIIHATVSVKATSTKTESMVSA